MIDLHDHASLARIIRIEGDEALADFGGIRKRINVSLVDVSEGDLVLVHEGFAIQVVEEGDRVIKELLE